MSDIEKKQGGDVGRAPEASPAAEKQKKGGAKKRWIALGAVAVLFLTAAILLAVKLIVPSLKYKAAMQLCEDGRYEEAIAAFEALGDYKDSPEQKLDAEYQLALKLYEDGKYEEARIALEALDGYRDSEDLARDAAYCAAVELCEAGSYDEAITAFRALDGYRDSEAQLENCYIGKYGEERYRQILNLQPGDTYTFGAYEQDNDLTNGKEEIEWIVLDRDGMSVLLISKYALDIRPYHTPYANITWETCSLREWLNGEFLNEAFDPEEQTCILSSTVTADENPAYSVSPGNDTVDKIFILSIPEANTYFDSDSARQCLGTEYCYAQGVSKDDDGYCWWLLRTPGYESRLAAFITSYGSVSNRGDGVNHERSAIRPVMWINLLP